MFNLSRVDRWGFGARQGVTDPMYADRCLPDPVDQLSQEDKEAPNETRQS